MIYEIEAHGNVRELYYVTADNVDEALSAFRAGNVDAPRFSEVTDSEAVRARRVDRPEPVTEWEDAS